MYGMNHKNLKQKESYTKKVSLPLKTVFKAANVIFSLAVSKGLKKRN
jgi:hypothetical protein